jgi:hypothetical protein
MKAHVAAGGYVFLVTRTAPHESHMPLKELVAKEGKARTLFRNSRRWRDGKNARTGYIWKSPWVKRTAGTHTPMS